MRQDCGFYTDALVDRATGVLPADRAIKLDAHLASCADCAASFRVVGALAAAPLEPPVDLEARVREAVRQEANRLHREAAILAVPRIPVRRRRSGAWRPWALPAAAAAALAALWIGVGRPGTGPTATDPAGVVLFEEYEPYGHWPADGVFVAGQPVFSELSVDELERLLRELES
jgi:anti-sigma factor RsiW